MDDGMGNVIIPKPGLVQAVARAVSAQLRASCVLSSPASASLFPPRVRPLGLQITARIQRAARFVSSADEADESLFIAKHVSVTFLQVMTNHL